MPNNTNPQAIAFCNTKVRPVANEVMSAFLSAQTLITEWNSQNIASIIPNDSNPIQDGATTANGSGAGSGADGRPPITDAQVNILISNLNSFVAFFTANSNLILDQTMSMANDAQSVI
jgi:hypothetical protein